VIDVPLRAREGGDASQRAHPLYAFYPHLVARAAELVPCAAVAPRAPRTLEEHLDAAAAPRLRVRLAVALLSLLALPGTWWLARRFLPEPFPLAAAALAGTSLLALWFAQQARPHAAEAAFALLAVCAAVRLRERGGLGAYLLAGLAAALAIGTLQNGLAVLPPLALAVLLRAPADRHRALLGGLAALAVAALAVPLFYPFVFHGRAAGAELGEQGTLAVSGHRVFLGMFNGSGFEVVRRSLVEYDPLLSWLALAGLGAGLALLPWARRLGRERAADLAIVLAYALPYLVAIGLYQRTYQRFVLPLVPYLALAAAFGLWCLGAGLGRLARPLGAAGIAAVLAAALVQARWAWRLSDLRARPDTVQLAARWIAANVQPESERVDVMPGLEVPLFVTPEALGAQRELRDEQSLLWYRHLAALAPGAAQGPAFDLRVMPLITVEQRSVAFGEAYAFARALPGRYAVIQAWPEKQRPALYAVREGLRGQYPLVARFAPDEPDTGENLPLAHQDDEYPYTIPWAGRILSAARVGPAVEIYRLR
jgi:hypothetical protein